MSTNATQTAAFEARIGELQVAVAQEHEEKRQGLQAATAENANLQQRLAIAVQHISELEMSSAASRTERETVIAEKEKILARLIETQAALDIVSGEASALRDRESALSIRVAELEESLRGSQEEGNQVCGWVVGEGQFFFLNYAIDSSSLPPRPILNLFIF